MLSIGKKALGCPVEIEFAVNISKDVKPEFCLLQIKPVVLTGLQKIVDDEKSESKKIFCKSDITLGDGKIENIKDMIVVRRDSFDPSKTTEIAKEVSRLNKKFKNDQQYIICGPGRWGSADPWLGIPVQWKQISQAKAIIEVGLKELPIDPSFGSHFFQNITSLHIAYITINPKSKNDQLDLKWIPDDSLVESTKYIDRYRFEGPLTINLDGTTGKGAVFQPLDIKKESMDEEESSGI